MRIATWNVNSVKARLGHVLDWLKDPLNRLFMSEEELATHPTVFRDGLLDGNPDKVFDAEWQAADPNLVSPTFFETYDIPLIEGRTFDARDLGKPELVDLVGAEIGDMQKIAFHGSSS